uniref:DUF4218 domain-containing protein n=1 Tax=Tanacetum cinerariifolium TaxID=118510 RepID=A0A6L2P479_TANCI|nr:hypothetical protein [Tanacetum cinerariifolium]
MSDMTKLLNDLRYIPPNNKHNEPTQGDIGETSNEPTQATRNKFEELNASANEEVYPGCDYVTRLDFMAKFTYFKVKGVETIDIALGQKFNMRAMVLWTINDFLARSSLSGWSGQEAILNTFLMNEKSKDTAKARQDLQRLGIRSGLWHGQTKIGKCLKPQAAYSFTPGKRKKFCQFIKGVKLPDGLQQYLPDKIAKPITELCSLFKQICSATLMEDDMLKPLIKVVDILCDLELIYHPALFDIMIHLVIHLPLKDLEGRPIYPQWMFPFERYMKKLKGYSFIWFDAQELKKVKWHVLHNSPEIDTYRSQFKSLFPNKDIKEEFPDWFGSQICQRHIDNEKDTKVSTTQLKEIIEFKYLLFKVVLFRVKWFDTRNQGRKVKCLVLRNNMTKIDCRDNGTLHIDGQSTEVDAPPDIIDVPNEDDDIIDDEDDLPHDLADFDDEDLINVDGDDNGTLHIDGQSTEVDAPPDIIDVPNEDNDIIDDEDALPHDLADFDDEDLINVDDDGVDKMLHGPTAVMVAVWIVPLYKMYLPVARVAFLTEEIMDKKGPVLIRFEVRDKQTLMPLGDHAAHWSSYIGEVIMGVPLYYPSWLKVSKARKASVNTDIKTQFDLRPHMKSPDWTEIDVGIQQQLQKAHIPRALSWKSGISICHTPDKAWIEYVSGGVTLLYISSTKHKERPLRSNNNLIIKGNRSNSWEQQVYLQNEHYTLWEVIEFGDSYQAPPEETSKGSASESFAKKKGRIVALTTEDIQKRRNDVKARMTLLLALPDEHQLRFSKYETAQEL